MNRGKRLKTVNAILTKKMNDWLEHIEDEELRRKVKPCIVVTGGSIASMLMGEPVNDFDVYLTKKSVLKDLVQYYITKFQSGRSTEQNGVRYSIALEELLDTHGEERIRIVVKSAGIASDTDAEYNYFEGQQDTAASDYLDQATYAEGKVDENLVESKPPYHPLFLSSNAITLKNDVQVIVRFFGKPEDIHKNYDFVHCTNYWTFNEGCVVNEEALLALMSKTLIYRGSRYPVCSLFRTKKFIERGFHINAGQYLKMAMQISNLDLSNFTVLEEQLTGVDVAYFQEVLSKVEAARDDENSSIGDSIDTTYLMEIINRFFD